MKFQVSGEVELKCLRLPGGLSRAFKRTSALESFLPACPLGRLAFPFIDPGKDLRYIRERKKEKKKEKNRGEEGPGAMSSFFYGRRVPLVV
jgi:hypothetical protein